MYVRQVVAGLFAGWLFLTACNACRAQDVTPPQLVAVLAENATTLRLTFNEPVAATAGNPARYLINPGGLVPATAARDAAQTAQVVLTLATALVQNANYTLLFNGIADLAGNTASGTATFQYIPLSTPAWGDVVLNEVMAAPMPPALPVGGLPDAEYVELFNRSSKTFSLAGWRMTDAAGVTGTLPAALLRPGQFVLLCANSRVGVVSAFGNTLGLAVPANFLNDGGDSLALTDGTGRLIHAFAYTRATYQDSVKARGGFALEMSDPNNTCPFFGTNTNYRAAENAAGGTPGAANSILNKYRDLMPSVLLGATVQDPTTIVLRWNKPLDKNSAEATANYTLQPGNIVPAVALLNAADTRHLMLMLPAALPATQAFTLTASNITDCPGNVQRTVQTTTIIAGRAPQVGDVRINEILFDPRPGGQRYVELASTSTDYLNLRGLQLARGQDSAQSRIPVTATDWFLPPGGFAAITRDSNNVKAAYGPIATARFVQTQRNLPAYDATTDGVWLLATGGVVLDQFVYSKSWHSPDLTTTEGVALERLSNQVPAQTAANWASASQAANLGTPGYTNSQDAARANSTNAVWLQPETFAPEAAPLVIGYHFAQAGTTLALEVYDLQGRRIRRLQDKTLVSTAPGTVTWDGTDDGTRRLPVGVYLVLATAQFNGGSSRVYRLPCVLAAKF